MLRSAAALLAASVSLCALGQVYSPTSGTIFSEVNRWHAIRDIPADTLAVPNGDRYVVGSAEFGKIRIAYLTKVSPTGQLIWNVRIPGRVIETDSGVVHSRMANAVGTQATSVARGSNHVYVSVQQGAGSWVNAYDESTGNLVWQSQAVSGLIEAMSAGSQDLVYCGENRDYNLLVQLSASTGLEIANDNAYHYDGSVDGYWRCLVRLNTGAVVAGGRIGQLPSLIYWNPATGMSAGDANYHTSPGAGFKEMAFDSKSQTVYALAEIPAEPSDPNDYTLIQNAHYHEGDHILRTYDGEWLTYGRAGSIAADDQNIFVTVNRYNPNNHQYTMVLQQATHTDVLQGAIAPGWSVNLGHTNRMVQSIDLTLDPTGKPLVTAADIDPANPDDPDSVYVQFQWTLEGHQFNQLTFKNPAYGLTLPLSDAKNLVSNVGSTSLFYAPVAGGDCIQFASEFSGPDDAYDGVKNHDLTVDAAHGVLRNDPNYFYSGQTATLVDGSLSAGLTGVILQSDGSFVATPAPGFHADATFRYQSTSVEHTVTIHFKGSA